VSTSVEQRCSARSAKGFLTATHRQGEWRSQNEQRLKADAAYDLDFFRLAPRLTARRLPRHSAFGRAALPPLTQTSLEEDSTRPRKTSSQKGASATSPFWDSGGGLPPGWFFLPTKTIPFLSPPPPYPTRGERSARFPEITPATIKSMTRGRDK
jgi:hypothetical protein